MGVSRRVYEQNVFINCPFDREYSAIFDAIVFTVFDCGFRPVCARERMNSAQIRIDKITDLIRDSANITIARREQAKSFATGSASNRGFSTFPARNT